MKNAITRRCRISKFQTTSWQNPTAFGFPCIKVQIAVTWLVIAGAQTYLHCAAGATRSDIYVILASLAYMARKAAGCMRQWRADYLGNPLQGFPRLVSYYLPMGANVLSNSFSTT